MGYLSNLTPSTNDSQWDLIYKVASTLRSILSSGIPTGAPARTTWAVATFDSGTAGVASRLSSDSTLYVCYALLIPDSGNADTITFGPDSGADLLSAPVGLQQEIKPADGTSFRLYDWYGKAPTTANQIVSILYQPE